MFRAQYSNKDKKVMSESIRLKNVIIFMVSTNQSDGINYYIDQGNIYNISFVVNDDGLPRSITIGEKSGRIALILRRESPYMKLAPEEEIIRINNIDFARDFDSIFGE